MNKNVQTKDISKIETSVCILPKFSVKSQILEFYNLNFKWYKANKKKRYRMSLWLMDKKVQIDMVKLFRTRILDKGGVHALTIFYAAVIRINKKYNNITGLWVYTVTGLNIHSFCLL